MNGDITAEEEKIDEKTLATLEYGKVLSRVAAFAASVSGRDAVLSARPHTDLARANAELQYTAECHTLLSRRGINPAADFDPADAIIEKCRVYSVLTCGELLKLARVLRVARLIKTAVTPAAESLKLPNVAAAADAIMTAHGFETTISDNVLGDDGLADSASTKLSDIRARIRRCNADIREKLNSYIRSPSHQKYLQDNIITVRGGRYVLAVKQEYRKNIAGLVHDQSATGATLFIEPMPAVELNNRLKTLAMDEQTEIERILAEYTALAAGLSDTFISAQKYATLFDLWFARAQYALDVKAVLPTLNDRGILDAAAARHPLLNPEKVVPVDAVLGGEYRMLVITGPNTGGKTVSLITFGLLCAAAASGLFVPAGDGACIPVFRRILCDLGDEQSIEQNLSTFSSHITRICEIVARADKDTLVLLDELGAGTDPREGAALAVAIARYLLNSGCACVVTTHYGELKAFSVSDARVRNASVQFDNATYLPTYRLVIGLPGSSCALRIAEHLGLNAEIIADARENAGVDSMGFEEVLRGAEQARLLADKEREENAALNQKLSAALLAAETERDKLNEIRMRISQNAKNEARRIASQSAYEAELLIAEMKELMQNADEKSLFEMKRLKNRAAALEHEFAPEEAVPTLRDAADADITVGATVYIKPLKGVGAVVSVQPQKREATVRAGAITVIVPYSDIAKRQEE
jgi:DNA mismatch repair protein MutS2